MCGLQILVANDMACELFAFDESELIGCQLTDLLSIKSRGIQSTSELHLRDNGEVIEVAGKVVSWVATLIRKSFYQIRLIILTYHMQC